MKQQPITSLNKENFWNELTVKYPEQMKLFLNWVNDYKQRVNWDNIFAGQNTGGQRKVLNFKTPVSSAPKFHDLPIAMQIGIFFQYCTETPHRYELIEGMPGSMPLFAECIKAWFAAEEHHGRIVNNDVYEQDCLYNHPDNFAKN